MPRAMATAASVNSSRSRRRATKTSSRGTTRAPTTTMRSARSPARARAKATSPTMVASAVVHAPRAREDREAGQQHEHDDREEVLDDEPAHGDAPLPRQELASLHQGAHEDDGAGHRDGQSPRTMASPVVQPMSTPSSVPRTLATRIGTSAPGNTMRRTATRSRREKWSPTPNISRMTPISASSRASSGAGDEAGRERADEHARDEVADDGRHAQAPGDDAEERRQREADGDGRDEQRVRWALGMAIVQRRVRAGRRQPPSLV